MVSLLEIATTELSCFDCTPTCSNEQPSTILKTRKHITARHGTFNGMNAASYEQVLGTLLGLDPFRKC